MFPIDLSTTDVLTVAVGFLFMALVVALATRKKTVVSKVRRRWTAEIPAKYIIEEEGE